MPTEEIDNVGTNESQEAANEHSVAKKLEKPIKYSAAVVQYYHCTTTASGLCVKMKMKRSRIIHKTSTI
jgi:hypothetical protein